MFTKKQIICSLIFLFPLIAFNSKIYGENKNEFDSLYTKGISKTRVDINISKNCVNKLNLFTDLSYVQKAKLNYLKSKVNAQEIKNNENRSDLISSDELLDKDSLIEKGISYIEHGYASKGLEIVYNFLANNKNNIPDTLQNYLNIKIAEGLRINMEYKKAIDILKNLLNNPNISPYNKSYTYNRLAAIYDVTPELLFQQRVDSVKKYSELSIAISEKHHFLYLLGLSQNELGSLYRLSSMDLKRSEYYCTLAVQNFIKIGSCRNAMNTSIILSDIYIRWGEFQMATKPLYQALDYLNIIGNEDMYMRVYLQLAKSHYLLNDYYNAYEFLSVGRLLEKLLFESSMDEKINEMSAKYNLALKESEISQRQNEINLQKKDIRYLSIILGVTLITLMVSLLYFLLKRKNLKQQQELEVLEKEKLKILFETKNKELEYKNKELAQSLAHDIDKNNVLKILKKEVNTGKSHHELIEIINSNIDTSQKWKKVLLDFQNLYPEFKPKLLIKHPDLTQNEIKICALLILKLSTSEISEVLSVSDSAVSKNRQRLRKKLNLDKEADLYEYLQKFI